MPFPLYTPLAQEAAGTCGTNPHLGLVFEKFVDGWSSPPHSSWEADAVAKRKFFATIAQRLAAMKTTLEKHLAVAKTRRDRLVLARQGKIYSGTTTARLIIGLGAGHPFEAGLTWHPTLGVPYLPGSTIKGAIRAWADPREQVREQNGHVLGWGDPDKWPKIRHLFGDMGDRRDGQELGMGSIIVFDALPVACPTLEVEIMTPHYGPYYQDAVRNPPADWYSPTPIPFLTVAEKQTFEFALAPSRIGRSGGTADLHKAKAELDGALQALGIGGKTAVGYGRMGDLKDVTEECEGKLHKEAEKERRARVASEHEARGAALSGVDKELAEFALAWQEAETPRLALEAAESKATELVKRLSSASPDDQQRIAQALKPFYIRIGEWQGKALNEKQKKKVGRIKEILGE